jgi:uncharacterized protein YegP (UPF0339 family)
MKIIIQKARDGKAYITLQARNGRVVLVSETYDSPSNARRAAKSIANDADDIYAPPWPVEDTTKVRR